MENTANTATFTHRNGAEYTMTVIGPMNNDSGDYYAEGPKGAPIRIIRQDNQFGETYSPLRMGNGLAAMQPYHSVLRLVEGRFIAERVA